MCAHRFLWGRVCKIGLNVRVHCVQELDVFYVRLEAHFWSLRKVRRESAGLLWMAESVKHVIAANGVHWWWSGSACRPASTDITPARVSACLLFVFLFQSKHTQTSKSSSQVTLVRMHTGVHTHILPSTNENGCNFW